jgi:hypothetical protein
MEAMTPDELRALIGYLRERISIDLTSNEILFAVPSQAEMLDAGLNPGGVNWVLHVPWWEEMVADIHETPEFCDPADTPEQVLKYARDVVTDYIRKRYPGPAK